MHGFVSVVVPFVALIALLLWAGLEDIRRREIANWKTGAIVLLAPVWWWANGLYPWPDVAAQIGLAIGVFAIFAAAFHFGWMGGGDVKLIAALALWLPFGGFVAMLVAMSLAGGAITLALIAEQRLRRRSGNIEIPYGVAIAFAAIVTIREPILNQLS
ncbi:prepilin peptidase [Sphingomonas bacterium]|uniref:A24 family peptidase n=1 Tax=Sphingomonas bacterium TaxID=1895847 RepID=UPI001575E4CB|nr:prepilin peptidase [Sphingomonas bacterium]